MFELTHRRSAGSLILEPFEELRLKTASANAISAARRRCLFCAASRPCRLSTGAFCPSNRRLTYVLCSLVAFAQVSNGRLRLSHGCTGCWPTSHPPLPAPASSSPPAVNPALQIILVFLRGAYTCTVYSAAALRWPLSATDFGALQRAAANHSDVTALNNLGSCCHALDVSMGLLM